VIEYRTYDGDAAELAAFLQRVWLSFFRGRVTVPVWHAEYLEWQLLSAPNGRDFLVAAYESARLVGTLFAKPFRFRLGEATIDAAISSWLAVDPMAKGAGVARGLADEQHRRMRECGCRFLLGFGLPGQVARGTRFWSGFPDRTVLGRPIPLWAHLIDLAAVSRDEATRHGRLGAHLLHAIHGDVRRPADVGQGCGVSIRPYRAADLSDCLAVVRRTADTADLAYDWDAERLGHHLDFRGIPTTLVAEQNCSVQGFINYHQLNAQGRGTLRSAIIDHLACDTLTPRDRTRLLRSALLQMHGTATQLVLTSRLSGAHRSTLVRSGFVPNWPGITPIYYTDGSGVPLSAVRTLQAHIV